MPSTYTFNGLDHWVSGDGNAMCRHAVAMVSSPDRPVILAWSE